MNVPKTPESNRREFLTGRAARTEIEAAGNALADVIVGDAQDSEAKKSNAPTGGSTVRLGTRAMACDFCLVMNPGSPEQVMLASDALDLIHELEAQMTVYREDSELSRLNRAASDAPILVEQSLFELLLHTRSLCEETDGAFDPTSGPLIELWRRCRQDGQIPREDEISDCLRRTGIEHVTFDETNRTISFDREGITLNLGGIGKGYALDRAGQKLNAEGFGNWLLHGGYSSVLARGEHNNLAGWPVGIRNPLFTKERLGTILLQECALSSSGSNVQYFRHDGKRYGHILDPRSGTAADKLLSVTVVAPTAAEADALSTAFFVLGVEKAREYCDNHPGVGALLIPQPRSGRKLEPIVSGIKDEVLFLDAG